MKIIKWIFSNILFVSTIFLLIFIPLYPKLPLLDVSNVWVYIRADDFIVLLVLLLWLILMLTKKITFKTPLTLPIMAFWIIGVISTIHGVLLIFPTLGAVFPNVAFLSYLRRIEYVGLFFVAYSGIKDKRFILHVVVALTLTLVLVSLYGIGQKYLGFPAFLTMNEEFAKGVPIQLSQLSRVSSTFAGHYDLAAYLVLIIPLLSSMILGFKNWFMKIFLLAAIFLGVITLFMTVSRVSFLVLLISLILMLAFYKKKFAIIATISLAVTIVVLSFTFSTSLFQRFGNTVKEVNVLIDATTGEALGEIKEFPLENYKDKTFRIKFAQTRDEIIGGTASKKNDPELATSSAMIIPLAHLPSNLLFLVQPNESNGESLPQGTGYINLTLAPIKSKTDQFFQVPNVGQNTKEDEIFAIRGNFLIKRVLAYDLSFTTRFQGGWPNALTVFKKDILFGGGYSSTGLAVDNNYLRILGEVGLLGFLSYFGIFALVVIYIKKMLPQVDSPVIKSFVIGFVAGMVGLALNAILIDVFEASKIAYLLWLLVGITVGVLHLYQKNEVDLYGELRKIISSPYTIVVLIFTATAVLFSSITNNYFVADDFTWFRWVADCKKIVMGNGLINCEPIKNTIINYFLQSDGFFYRPGTKLYFLLMYSGFWLNQTIYYFVSIFLHFTVTVLVFLISRRILKSFSLSILASFLFVILTGYSEAIFWISGVGHLFNVLFILSSLFFFMLWSEKKRDIFLVLSFTCVILSLMFHEHGLVAPLLIALYGYMFKDRFSFKGFFKEKHYLFLFFPILPYLVIRFFAHSHWLSGDYSYNFFMLPFNFIGNTIGYLMLNAFGPWFLPVYESLRNFLKGHITVAFVISLISIFILFLLIKSINRKINNEDRKIIVFGSLFFVISLLPFLGLGNITSRYSYLSSVGFVILLVFLLKKTYHYLISIHGKNISIASVILITSIFILMQVTQFQKIQNDWLGAGNVSKNFIMSLDNTYYDEWTKDHMRFFFVNVPQKVGDAWVFPVGLKDAVWFVFRNDNIEIYQLSSLNEAFNLATNPLTDRIFVFDPSGAVTRKEKPRIVAPPIK
ncbi:MAG: hypothetical protein ABH816_02635 [Candidatus Levyibacteriota bacterium]